MSFQKQQNKFGCGCASVHNACYHIDKKRHSQRRIKELAGTTIKEGTSARGIKKALTELGYETKNHVIKTEEAFKNKLIRSLNKGYAVIVLIDHLDHWVCCIGYENKQVIFLDSDRERRKLKYEYSLGKFLLRARNINKDTTEVYYELITVTK